MTIESNNDGSCLKFDNGIMIFYGNKGLNVTSTLSGSNYRATVNFPFVFPVAFIESPTAIIQTASDRDYDYCRVIGVLRNANNIQSVALERPTEFSGDVGLQCIAIGHWK